MLASQPLIHLKKKKMMLAWQGYHPFTETIMEILWPPDVKRPLIVKTLLLGKTEGRKRRGRERMRRLDGITDSMDMSLSKKAPGVGDGQGSLAYRSPWGRKELDTTEQLNYNNYGNSQA